MRKAAMMAVLGIAVVPALAGCSGPTVACTVDAVSSPGVWLDASPWLHAHPDATVRACLDTRCATSDRTGGVLHLIVPAGGRSSGTVRMTLTITSPAVPGLQSRRVVEIEEPAAYRACGMQPSPSADARLNDDGTISVWHGPPDPLVPSSPLATAPAVERVAG